MEVVRGEHVPSLCCSTVEPIDYLGRPGEVPHQGGQAVMEITCKEVVVEVKQTSKSYNKISSKVRHSNVFKFLDLAQGTLMRHASGRRCSPTTTLFFQGLDGLWYFHMVDILPIPEHACDRIQLCQAGSHLNWYLDGLVLRALVAAGSKADNHQRPHHWPV